MRKHLALLLSAAPLLAVGDEAAMKAQSGAVGRACKGCHDFRN